MSEYGEETRSSREGLKFVILAVVLIGAVVIVAVTRPLIFGRIVPAVMGENIVIPTPTPPVVEEEAEVEEESTETEDTGSEEATDGETAAPEEDDSAGEETAPEGETAVEEEAADAQEEAPDETAEDETATITHTIKQGETLQTIAAQYDVTVRELTIANKLTNPNYIRVGDELVIPQAEE